MLIYIRCTSCSITEMNEEKSGQRKGEKRTEHNFLNSLLYIYYCLLFQQMILKISNVFTQTKQQICLQFFFLSDKDKIFRSIWNFRQKLLIQRASQILSKYSLKTCNTAHLCGHVKLVFIPICKGNFHEDSVLWNWCTDL